MNQFARESAKTNILAKFRKFESGTKGCPLAVNFSVYGLFYGKWSLGNFPHNSIVYDMDFDITVNFISGLYIAVILSKNPYDR